MGKRSLSATFHLCNTQHHNVSIICRSNEPALKKRGFFFIAGKEKIVQLLGDYSKPYSMSRIRAFYSPEGCDFVYYLRYVRGFKGKYPSPVWLGHLIHTLMQQAYHGVSLSEAHRRVWQNECGPILRDLEQWYGLDEQYYRSGRPNTKARKLWLEAHPEYVHLRNAIEAYRDDVLREGYTWAKTASLSAYYRWSRLLVGLPLTQLLLPHTILVEGQPLYDEYGAVIDRFADPHDKREHSSILSCKIAGLTVVGTPDYVAVDPMGCVWIADGKVMSDSNMTQEDIAEDAQLNIYLEMLQQTGFIEPGQQAYLGHIYYTKSGIDKETGMPSSPGIHQVWSSPSPDALPRIEKQLLRMDRRIRGNDFFPIRGIATGTMARCGSCVMAAVCREHWRAYVKEFPI